MASATVSAEGAAHLRCIASVRKMPTTTASSSNAARGHMGKVFLRENFKKETLRGAHDHRLHRIGRLYLDVMFAAVPRAVRIPEGNGLLYLCQELCGSQKGTASCMYRHCRSDCEQMQGTQGTHLTGTLLSMLTHSEPCHTAPAASSQHRPRSTGSCNCPEHAAPIAPRGHPTPRATLSTSSPTTSQDKRVRVPSQRHEVWGA